MPPFGKTFKTDTEIWKIIAWIRSVNPKPVFGGSSLAAASRRNNQLRDLRLSVGHKFEGDPRHVAAPVTHERHGVSVGKLCGYYTGGNAMKNLFSIVALSFVVAFAVPALAAEKTPTTKAACEKAKMMWDDTTKKCSKGKM